MRDDAWNDWRACRTVLAMLLAGHLLFVVYGSLVPLRFVPVPWDEAVRRFAQMPWLALAIDKRADWVANALLFIPLGWLAAAQLSPRAGKFVRVAFGVAIVGSGALLSLTIEFVQIQFPDRTVSQNDVVAETVGAALGAALHVATARPVLRWLAGWRRAEGPAATARRLLVGYLAVLLVYALMPLDLTLNPVEILQKVNQGKVTLRPFADLPSDASALAYEVFAGIAIWVPVGALWRFGRPTTLGSAALRTAALAAVVEGLQLFVYSRHTTTTAVLLAALGGTLGHALLPRGWAVGSAGGAAHPAAPRAAVAWWVAWLVWLAGCAALFWYPFDIDTRGVFVRPRWDALARAPFATYYVGSEFHALTELLRRLAVFFVGGALWFGAASRLGLSRRAVQVAGVSVLTTVAAAIEAGQLFMPGKTPDATDFVLQAVGAGIGLIVAARLTAASATRPSRGLPSASTPDIRHVDLPSSPGSSSRMATPTAAAPRRSARRATAFQSQARDSVAAAPTADVPLGAAAAASIAVVAAAAWGAARLPGVPYNVRELLTSGPVAGFAAACALALLAWLLAVLPHVLAWRWRARAQEAWALPVLLPLAALGASLPVLVVDLESRDDVVGTAILGWPPAVEFVGRFGALFAAVWLAAAGGAWLLHAAVGTTRRPLAAWALTAALWALPLHFVVVAWAATDNLTELMRGGGGLATSATLFFGATLLAFGVNALAATAVGTVRRSAAIALAGGIAIVLGAFTLHAGSETTLLKYGQVFSAAQFLLSPDRQHYVGSGALATRFGVAVALLVAGAAVLQWASRTRRPRRCAAVHAADGVNAAKARDEGARRRALRMVESGG